ncbi:hypothetical protein VNO77_37525 [Canavalia gladiata]|uniref:histone acetyltransferase n=1 Tax=Canavalia gladiata TaxID=3824 RepID=A0AAN9KB64_CANGL
MMNTQNSNSVKLPSIPKTSSLISGQSNLHENRVKSEPGIEHHKGVLNSHVSEQFHMSKMQSQFQKNSSEDCSRGAQHLALSSSHHDLPSSAPQNSQQIISGQDEAQCNNLSSDGSIIGQVVASRGSAELLDSEGAIKKAHRNQQRWLLFLLHARRCSTPEGLCKDRFCPIAQKLCKHIDGCTLRHCPYPRCHHTRVLLHHFINCKDPYLSQRYGPSSQGQPQDWLNGKGYAPHPQDTKFDPHTPQF